MEATEHYHSGYGDGLPLSAFSLPTGIGRSKHQVTTALQLLLA